MYLPELVHPIGKVSFEKGSSCNRQSTGVKQTVTPGNISLFFAYFHLVQERVKVVKVKKTVRLIFI